MRKKTITLDGESVVIGALTSVEVTDWLTRQKETLAMDEGEERTEKMIALWKEFFVTSINNGVRNRDLTFPAEYKQLTVEDVDKLFDLTYFEFVRDESLAFNRLSGDGKSPMGEASAAS